MMKHKKYSLLKAHGVTLFFLLTILSQISCKKYLDIKAPPTVMSSEKVFTNSVTATAAITNIYSQMHNKSLPYFIALYTGLSGDELTSYSSTPELAQVYTNSLEALNNGGIYENIWQPAFSFIYQANAAIEGISSNNKNFATSVANQLTGESYFIRAFWNFYLVNLFGDIPLITSTNYSINSKASRTNSNLVFRQIIDDLLKSSNLLSSNFISSDNVSITTERVRPTKWAAYALLARTYLFLNKYDSAELYSSKVISNNSVFQFKNDVNALFVKNNKEAIWQLMLPQPSFYNTSEGEYFILNGPPDVNIYNCTTLSSQLLSTFEPNDLRFINWVGNISFGGASYMFPYKYKVRDDGTPLEYSTILRLTEQYLIRAEARAQLSNFTGSKSDLDLIRLRSGLPPSTGNDKGSLLSAIQHERQVEFFTEWGHRWMDLKRSGLIDQIMKNVCTFKGGTWNSNWQLYPIPQQERENNSNLSQNPGY